MESKVVWVAVCLAVVLVVAAIVGGITVHSWQVTNNNRQVRIDWINHGGSWIPSNGTYGGSCIQR